MDQKAIQPYYKSLESIYAPQRQLLQQQMKSLPQQYAMERSGLEQAKANAFRDISSKARGMGVAFGGYSPSEQARYTGATYLPTLGKIQQAQTEGLTSLQSALNQLYGTQQKEAMGLWSDAQKRAEEKRQFDAQLAAQRTASARSYSSSGGGTTSAIPKGFTTSKNKEGGTNFFGPNRAPITAAQYYSGIGGSVDDLANFLRVDADRTSQKAYKDLIAAGGVTEALVNKYPWIFGG